MSKLTVVITHKVADYASWRKAFDAHADVRNAAGIKITNVFTSVEDPNEVTVFSEGDEAAYGAFFGNPDAQKVMAEAGVVSAPTLLKLVSQN